MMKLRVFSRDVVATIALGLILVACTDTPTVGPRLKPKAILQTPIEAFIVSNAVSSSQASTAQAQLHAFAQSASEDVAYVSMPPGSVPTGISATVRNVSSNSAATPAAFFVDGGLDPIAIAARASDELDVEIVSVGFAPRTYRLIVPVRRPPKVVRTNPPKGGIDIPLNLKMTVVFSEPMSADQVSSATVQLRQGATSVPGTARLLPGSPFTIEFFPAAPLAGFSAYELVLTRGIADAGGDSLEDDYAIRFTTASSGSSAYTSIVAGASHSCALRANGTAICWGANAYGQLGAGTDVSSQCKWDGDPGYLLCSKVPLSVVGGHLFTSLVAGFDRTCGVTASGDLFCWGYTHSGGFEFVYDPNSGPRSDEYNAIPRRMGGNVPFKSISAGFTHTCGVDENSLTKCWGGDYSSGALGNGLDGGSPTPVAVAGGIHFKSVRSGQHHTCGLDESGLAYCWGLNIENQIGVSRTEVCRTPATPNDYPTWWCARQPTKVSGGLSFATLSLGSQHSCGLTSDGRAYCWGSFGEAGTVGFWPTLVSNGLTFTTLSTGGSSTQMCGITSANDAYCWGGVIGAGPDTQTLSPKLVPGGLKFSAIAAGGEHTCAITTGGELYCWGTNYFGNLATGSADAGSRTPLRVVGQ